MLRFLIRNLLKLGPIRSAESPHALKARTGVQLQKDIEALDDFLKIQNLRRDEEVRLDLVRFANRGVHRW